MYRLRFLVLVAMILAAASRLVPHLLNFAPIGAMALFDRPLQRPGACRKGASCAARTGAHPAEIGAGQ
jgi:hypothetical protein